MEQITVSRWTRAWRTAGKVVAYGSMLLIAAVIVAHFVWRYTGSDEWKLDIDKNGIQVFSRKPRGSTLKQVKGITQIKTTLNHVVAAMTDTTTAGCRKWDGACTALDVLEPWDSKRSYVTQYFHTNLPKPFMKRDSIMRTQLSRNIDTNELLVQVTALPQMLAPNACCERVSHVNNSWRYRPLDNGRMQVEFNGDFDFGIPYPLFNSMIAQNCYELMASVEKIINSEENRSVDLSILSKH